MKLILIVTLGLLFTTQLFADSFHGSGVATFFKTQREYRCQEIFLRFEINQSNFKLFEGGYNCPPLNASYDFFKLEISNGKLYQGDLEVGDINEHGLNLFYDDPSDDSRFHLQLLFAPNHLTYKERWYQSDILVLEISGNLQKH